MDKIRGFEVISAYKDQDLNLPTRATTGSAGYDFFLAEAVIINPGETVMCKTGVKAYMLNDEVLEIYPRSSLGVKKHLRLANSVGIIDSDYYNNDNNEGHIMIPLFNFGDTTIKLEQHERIAQGIFKKYLVVDYDQPTTNQRCGGFGSTNEPTNNS